MSSTVKITRKMKPRLIRPRSTITTRGKVRGRKLQLQSRSKLVATGCSDDGKDFIRCALDPFGADSARVPDGNGGMSTHIKYTSTTTFSAMAGSTTACVAGIASLPAGLIAVDGTFAMLDRTGNPVGKNVSPTGESLLIPFVDLVNAAGINPVTSNHVNISRARVVSYGLEVRQTGPILGQGGVSCTARFPLDVTDAVLPNQLAPGAYTAGTIAGLGDVMTRGITSIPQTFSQLQSYPGTVTCNSIESCRLIGTPAAYEYSSMEYGSIQGSGPQLQTDMTLFLQGKALLEDSFTVGPPATVTVGGNQIGPGSDPLSMVATAGDLALYSSFWYDKNCDALIWAAQNLSTTMVFEARFTLCVEVQISHQSSIYRPFISMAPASDPKALAIVDEVHRQIPASVPAPTSNSNWWANLSSAVIGIGDLAASMSIPVVSQVGALASRFAKMLV